MRKILKSDKNNDPFILFYYVFRINTRNATTINRKCVVKTCNASESFAINYFDDLESFVLIKNHSHSPDIDLIEKKEKRKIMKELMKITNSTPRFVVSPVLKGANNLTIGNIGKEDTLYKILRKC